MTVRNFSWQSSVAMTMLILSVLVPEKQWNCVSLAAVWALLDIACAIRQAKAPTEVSEDTES